VKNSKVAKRKKLKARIPKLVRQESWRYKRVKVSWRRPTGVTNRMRRRRGGWPKTVSVGYKTQEELRHLHPSGFKEVNIYRPSDLGKLDPKTCVARIGHTVGERKRVAILDRARELQIRILNPRVARREEVPKVEEPPSEVSEAQVEKAKPEVAQEQPREEATA